jgi:uncharacterized protein YidB (DUF937 family)
MSTGDKLPVSRDKVTQVVGQDVIQQIVRMTRMSPEALSAKLMEALPMVWTSPHLTVRSLEAERWRSGRTESA